MTSIFSELFKVPFDFKFLQDKSHYLRSKEGSEFLILYFFQFRFFHQKLQGFVQKKNIRQDSYDSIKAYEERGKINK